MKKLLLVPCLLIAHQAYALDRITEEYRKFERQRRQKDAQGGEQRTSATPIRQEKKIDIPAKGPKLNKALLDAVKAGKPDVAAVKAYLNAGADVNWTDAKNDYPFSARELAENYAKNQPTKERLAVRSLVSAIGGERLAEDLKNSIKNGDIRAVSALIKRGANPKMSVKGQDAWAVLQSAQVLRKIGRDKVEEIKNILRTAQ